ncbi:uncharacterized protein LOC123511866 [Portunus trituberculatus]|uniref:uncharacterized protein LOC123511866 n=1 Tax=Portunus trituberculatus TaxID=210409 RepID=UPI001E1CB548|nr:uncharacterized protein LOC123511866 [Portunus trituberculatus]
MASTGLTAPVCLVVAVVVMAAWRGGASNTTHGTTTPHNHTNATRDLADMATNFRYSVLGVTHKLREEEERNMLDGDQEDSGSDESDTLHDTLHDTRHSVDGGVSAGVRAVSGAPLKALYELYALVSYIASVSDGETDELKGSNTTYTSDKDDLNEKKKTGTTSSYKKRLNLLKKPGSGHLNALYTLHSLVTYVRGDTVEFTKATKSQSKGKHKRTIAELEQPAQYGENYSEAEEEEEEGKESKDLSWSFYVVIAVSVLVVVACKVAIVVCVVRFCRRAVFSFGSKRPIVRGMCSPVS